MTKPSAPRFAFLLSRRDRNGPFMIRSRQELASFHNDPARCKEKAEKYLHEQRTAWQGVEHSTEFKIAFSGGKVEGYEEGLPHA